MKNCLLYIYLILLCIVQSTNSYANDVELLKKFDSLLFAHKPLEVLIGLDSLIEQNHFDLEYLNQVKYLKFKSLVLLNEYSHAVDYSAIIKTSFAKDTLFLIKYKIKNALLQELIGDSTLCKKELVDIEKIYETHPKNTEDYAEFLYRYSSFYRVNGYPEKAIPYAKLSNKIALENNYLDAISVSSFLLGFMTDDKLKQLNYFQVAINHFKNTGDTYSSANMYSNIAYWHYNQEDFETALLYVDSGIAIINTYKVYDVLSSSYSFKSKILAKLNRFKEAYHYAELYKKSDERSVLQTQKKDAKLLTYKLNKKQQEENLDFAQNKQVLLRKQLIISVVSGMVILMLFLLLAYAFKKLKNSKKVIEKNNVNLSKLYNDKNELLREVQHRTKNNFSLILSLIDLQQSNPAKATSINENFETLKNRIEAISKAHHLMMDLYDKNEKELEQEVQFNQYINEIIFSLRQLTSDKIEIETSFINMETLNTDTAIPIGTIINELLTNTIKHAKPIKGAPIKVYIRMAMQKENIKLVYCDNGTEFIKDKDLSDSIGMVIIESMVQQLKGSINRINSNYLISLKLKNER